MKKINGYWVDENNNKWDCGFYTEEIATELSETLIGCTYCTNCTNCRDCRDCIYCRDCTNCRDCIYCRDCTNCTYCRDCTNCTNCTDCTDCINCTDFKNNPSHYATKKIGSRNDVTHFYYDEEENKNQVICGCFKGTLEEFEKAVEKTHNNNVYAKEYKKEIKKVKILFELNEK